MSDKKNRNKQDQQDQQDQQCQQDQQEEGGTGEGEFSLTCNQEENSQKLRKHVVQYQRLRCSDQRARCSPLHV